MKPVLQQRISDVNGDCHAACIASLLEIPSESMPDFFWAPKGETPNAYLRRTHWLRSRGLQEAYWLVGSFPAPGGYGILSVGSAIFPGLTHSVVWHGNGDGWGAIVHNPNPQDKRGIDIRNENWIGFWVLAPLDPSGWGKMVKKP